VKCHLARFAIWICRLLPAVFYRAAAEFGQSIEFSLWVTRDFGRDSAFFATRERLWRRMLSLLKPDSPVTVFEFGVAYGYTTRWWLSRAPGIDKWYGFDTFTGLPRAWRHFPAGAFDAGGKPPDISDPRVEWVVGRVEETFDDARMSATLPGDEAGVQRVFIFDLDLYQPTKHVAERVFPRLRPGDLVYFDQAVYLDERRALAEEISRSAHALKLVGATPLALALQVVPGADDNSAPRPAGTPAGRS
jgi:hypothetical protein